MKMAGAVTVNDIIYRQPSRSEFEENMELKSNVSSASFRSVNATSASTTEAAVQLPEDSKISSFFLPLDRFIEEDFPLINGMELPYGVVPHNSVRQAYSTSTPTGSWNSSSLPLPNISDPYTPVSTVSSEVKTSSQEVLLRNSLCGFPAFCSHAAVKKCQNITLWECEACSQAGSIVFVIFLSLLGLAILTGNLFVIWCKLSRKKGFAGAYNTIKASLAIADLLTGFEIYFVAMYNFSWTMNGTASDLDYHQLALRGSPQAYVGGIFFFFSFTSSLYHLVFLGQQRLHAIKWPFQYKAQRKRVIYIGICVIWLLSFIAAVSPTWFPEVFTYTYSHTIFLYTATLKTISSKPDVAPLVLLLFIVFIIPFILMTCFTIVSVATIRSGTVLSRKLSQSKRTPHFEERINIKEVTIFRTLAVMQLGFTLTLVPVLVVTILQYNGVLDCTSISTPYIVCFYLSMSNSLVNVLVYSNLDPNFRAAVLEAFHSCYNWKKTAVPSRSRSVLSRLSLVRKSKTANSPSNKGYSVSSAC